jgi:hypothetical protein
MGFGNTPHQIYASKFLNQASKSANSNTAPRGGVGGVLTCATKRAPRPEEDRAGGDAEVEEERLGWEGAEVEEDRTGDTGLGRKPGRWRSRRQHGG